jgi:hypothetical protein
MTHLETKQALTELIFRVNRHYEMHEYEQMVACYTEDAHYKNWRGDTVGRAAILGLMARREPERLVRHVLSNVTVSVHDDLNAEACCYVTAFLSHRGHPLIEAVPHALPPAVAEYRLRFRRDAGVWLISEKLTIEVFLPELQHANSAHGG